MANGYNFLDPMNHSTYLMNDYPNTYQEAVAYGETLAPLGPNSPQLRPQLQKDGYYKSDGNDDGHISGFEKFKAMLKGGTVNMVKGLFCDKDGFSWKRTLVTSILGTAIAFSGPVGLAVAGGIGLIASLGHLANSSAKAKNAATDQEARDAFEGIGESVTSAGLSLFGGYKGIKGIKNNFSWAKNNPDMKVKFFDKFKKWNASRAAVNRAVQQSSN